VHTLFRCSIFIAYIDDDRHSSFASVVADQPPPPHGLNYLYCLMVSPASSVPPRRNPWMSVNGDVSVTPLVIYVPGSSEWQAST